MLNTFLGIILDQLLMLMFTMMITTIQPIDGQSCIEQPRLVLQQPENRSNLLNRGVDFVDLMVGSNLTLSCSGTSSSTLFWDNDLPTGSSNNNSDYKRDQQIYWILPEYHPYYDPILPEYIHIEEFTVQNGNSTMVESHLSVNSVETNDVGFYTCVYRKYLHLFEDIVHQTSNTIYLFVTDYENLFVKSMPITMGIYGKPSEIGCRPSSSKAIVHLIEVNEHNGIHVPVPFRYAELNPTAKDNWFETNGSVKMVNYNPRRGFLLPNLTNDRFICRVMITKQDDDGQQVNVSSDENIIVHYTNGIDYATDPLIEYNHYPYTFVGQTFGLSCITEKSHSSTVFIKWNFVNQSCYEVNSTSSLVRMGDVETIILRKGKEKVRLNLTLVNVNKLYNGAQLECIISDVSLAHKRSAFRLKVFDEPRLQIIPLSQTTQIHRCNANWKFEVEIIATPNEIDGIKLFWYKHNENQSIKYGDTRIHLSKQYLPTTSRVKHAGTAQTTTIITTTVATITSSTAYPLNQEVDQEQQNYTIRAAIWIKNLSPADTGTYILKADLMNSLAVAKQTFELKVLDCHISDLDENYILYILGIASIIFIMLLFIFLLVNRINIEKKAKRELEILSINLLSNACIEMVINPEIPIHEQLDMLKYDHRWEVSLENIEFHQMLGQGAFGKVYKANAHGLRKIPKAYELIIGSQDRVQINDLGGKNGTVVAVKMLKNYATMDQLKALSSELKVMNYIGYHANIVNLLGACTSKLIKGELYVLMEYCCNGNLQQFLQSKRDEFQWETPENNHLPAGKKNLEPIKHNNNNNNYHNDEVVPGSGDQQHFGSWCAAAAGGIEQMQPKLFSRESIKESKRETTEKTIEINNNNNNQNQNQNRNHNQNQEEPDILVSLGHHQLLQFWKGKERNHHVSSRKHDSRAAAAATNFDEQYIEMRCNPVGQPTMEIRDDTTTTVVGSHLETLTLKDLLCFAHQTANGMDYLASKKVVHRDLAARNVLLCRNKIVKICDFGLARDYSNEANHHHQNHHHPSNDTAKQTNERLPVKWMAIESLCERIFTSKSDVWSYGVFLWELFTLGRAPYPNLSFNDEFVDMLRNGYRMEKPEYCSQTIYKIMLQCWSTLAEDRPDFKSLAQFFQQQIEPQFLKAYQRIACLYAEANREIEADAHFYEGLNPIAGSSTPSTPMTPISTAQDDYLRMSTITTTTTTNQNQTEMVETGTIGDFGSNYVQMESAKFNLNNNNFKK